MIDKITILFCGIFIGFLITGLAISHNHDQTKINGHNIIALAFCGIVTTIFARMIWKWTE